MKSRNIADFYKNAMGTVFLLAGAFFVCSTLVSMRAVFADPVAPTVQTVAATPQAANARTGRASPRSTNTSTATNPRGATTARTVSSRATTSRATVGTTSASRAATTSTNAARSVANRASTRTTVSNARNVRSRAATTSAANMARVSLSGSAIRGSKAATSSQYSYLSSKLYTGNYSNIIDSTTGLISADAYSNCLESYYTCMDEICTARNESQGRCSCAARVQAFSQAQKALEAANEELIRVSGELALLIATKGKDVSSAFLLTDAEKIMNCASYMEVAATRDEKKMKKWCESHPEYKDNSVGECSLTVKPSYCTTMATTYKFDINDLGGSGSDILASLKSWADAKDKAAGMLIKDDDNLLSKYTGVMDIVSGMTVAGSKDSDDAASLDKIANTWGYDLFEYAHNNVCSRVLDSCFNGIYEACGNPPSGGKCANGATTGCPYNYNSKVTVSSNGDVILNERGSSNTSSGSASCFGYASSSGDPYSSLRGPVADARRSVMQKYLLDANAACDVYGEQLRTTAQNISYQKVAAQQALQQKRLEFAQEETAKIATDYKNAINNFNNCLADLYDCYTTQEKNNSSWSTKRIKSYCSQVSNAPSCYEQMICGTSDTILQAVIDVEDKESCEPDPDIKTNDCRNVVTISEILSDSYADGFNEKSSKGRREACLKGIGIDGVREWERGNDDKPDW